MTITSRRQFVQKTTLALVATGLSLPSFGLSNPLAKRKFKMSINPGALGLALNQKGLLEAASKYGFEAIVAFPEELATMTNAEIQALKKEMEAKHIGWGSSSLPMDFRKEEAKFREGLTKLPSFAAALAKVGASRMNTWIMPTHDTLTYRENFEQHAERLREIGQILGHYHIDLGLEYVGPKTLMARDRYAFIRSMKEVKELIASINLPNVKIQLDSFHWFCAGETVADILSLSKTDIVTVDLNDARAGISADEQIDNKRELPLGGGVIDLKAFLDALVQIGYDGPVRAEPFNQPLRDMPDDQALKATYEAMRKAFDLI